MEVRYSQYGSTTTLHRYADAPIGGVLNHGGRTGGLPAKKGIVSIPFSAIHPDGVCDQYRNMGRMPSLAKVILGLWIAIPKLSNSSCGDERAAELESRSRSDHHRPRTEGPSADDCSTVHQPFDSLFYRFHLPESPGRRTASLIDGIVQDAGSDVPFDTREDSVRTNEAGCLRRQTGGSSQSAQAWKLYGGCWSCLLTCALSLFSSSLYLAYN